MDPQTTPQPPVNNQPAQPEPPLPNVPPVAPATDDRRQVTDSLKSATNVLVTVGSDPSVDELASALGLTLVLDKLGKHATTLFSGEIPKAIEFLDPEATFEDNIDSLRDFIIALDKEKADKLRYKVEEDVVRIFITPYKTKISEKDLVFSQGDFNIDVVVALGVVSRDDLDKVITAHGRILHDAKVITINTGSKSSSLGSTNWSEDKSSSIAEMLSGISESLGSDLHDSQISTAYLTGIVAATNRFSNDKTSPKVMTMAAQLMAAGANQQLIASNLRQDGVLSESIREPGKDHAKESEVVVDHDKSDSDKKKAKKKVSKFDKKVDSLVKLPETKTEDGRSGTEETLETKTEDGRLETEGSKEVGSLVKDVKRDDSSSADPVAAPDPKEVSGDEPAFNATMAQAKTEDDVETKTEDGRSETGESQGTVTPDAAGVSSNIAPPTDQTLSTMPSNLSVPAPSLADAAVDKPVEGALNEVTTEPVVAPVDESAIQDDALEEARKAVESATDSQPFDPANNPAQSINAQPLPDVTHEPQVKPANEPVVTPATPSFAQEGQSSLPSVDLPMQPVVPEASSDEKPNDVAETTLPPAPSPDKSFISGDLDEPEASPMDSFMSAHSKPTISPTTDVIPVDSQPKAPDLAGNSAPGLPPLPPLPQSASTDGSLPPLPPVPGQENGEVNSTDPTASFQPQTQPAFMQDTNASQNPWTQAADDLVGKKETEDQTRQAKMDQMTQQYDKAVDRNQELQGKPPINDPRGSGLPPVKDDHSTFPMPPAPSV
jgi:hypothetical protein